MKNPEMDLVNLTLFKPKEWVEVQATMEPGYMHVYEFERYDLPGWRKFMTNNWTLSIHLSIIYLILIYLVQETMKSREPFVLRKALVMWNFTLATFSFIGFYRMLPEFAHTLSKPNGLHKSICHDFDSREHSYASSFWALLFILSKAAEFGDTFFIVLRKRKLIFLHWYHHVTVCIFCWCVSGTYEASSFYFIIMNYFVHALMYSYYTSQALQIKIPKSICQTLTILQMSQMGVGILITCYALYRKVTSNDCATGYRNITLALAMYASYLILFGVFFRKTYCSTRQEKKKEKLN